MMQPRTLVGILGVLQTPFQSSGNIDLISHTRLIEDAIEGGGDGFLVPAIASENAYLSYDEKVALAKNAQEVVQNRIPVIWGAGSSDIEECVRVGTAAVESGADGLLVAVPPELYGEPATIVEFFKTLSRQTPIPLMIQDWAPNSPGMELATILELIEKVPTFRFLKIETLPAGPKYTQVLEATAGTLHVSGGWAVPQMIEALDRGVHAMIPECSMIRVYKAIDRFHRSGERETARSLFERLLPILTFSNQNLDTSIRFFKKLLVHKGIFATAKTRLESPEFDAYSEEIASELVDRYLSLENDVLANVC
ncbi:MAG: dihydrodipicolinate synthase family protein [Candidatus Omnitrophica bacterium]|nr:dihydrodipicolinate synthase family protein [Candidatus Omnitrophota bacterium]